MKIWIKFQNNFFYEIYFLSIFYKTPLFAAAKKGNTDIIEVLLSLDKTDINLYSIFN